MIVSLHPRITSLLIPMASPFCQALNHSSVVLRQTYYDRRSISDKLNVLRQTKYVKKKKWRIVSIGINGSCHLPAENQNGWMRLAVWAEHRRNGMQFGKIVIFRYKNGIVLIILTKIYLNSIIKQYCGRKEYRNLYRFCMSRCIVSACAAPVSAHCEAALRGSVHGARCRTCTIKTSEKRGKDGKQKRRI